MVARRAQEGVDASRPALAVPRLPGTAHESAPAPPARLHGSRARQHYQTCRCSHAAAQLCHLWTPPFHARENVGVVFARGRMLSSVRPMMRQEDSRRPVWEFADRVQITQSVLEAQWKALVVPAPSHRLLRHTLLPLALTSSRSWSAYAAAVGVL